MEWRTTAQFYLELMVVRLHVGVALLSRVTYGSRFPLTFISERVLVLFSGKPSFWKQAAKKAYGVFS